MYILQLKLSKNYKKKNHHFLSSSADPTQLACGSHCVCLHLHCSYFLFEDHSKGEYLKISYSKGDYSCIYSFQLIVQCKIDSKVQHDLLVVM